MRDRWLKIHMRRIPAYGNARQATSRQQDPGDQPRISVAEAIEQSAAMVDRYDRMIVRNIRALRDLRRYTGQVLINNAGQVNIGAQQINATGDVRATPRDGQEKQQLSLERDEAD